jgi:hypothetical protein
LALDEQDLEEAVLQYATLSWLRMDEQNPVEAGGSIRWIVAGGG